MQIKRESSSAAGDQYFCVGNIVDSNKIVTAAHCLNQVFSSKEVDIKNLNKRISTNIAFGIQYSSQSFEISKNLSSVYVPPDMDEPKERAEYLKSALLEKVKSDYAVIEFSKPFPKEVIENCPTMPSESDCKFFNEYLDDPVKDLNRTSGDFYRSNFVKVGQGASGKEITYPSNKIVSARVSSIEKSEKYGYLNVTVADPRIKHSFVVGDSGSGLLWLNQDRRLLIGIQSAASADGGVRALFANLCSRVN